MKRIICVVATAFFLGCAAGTEEGTSASSGGDGGSDASTATSSASSTTGGTGGAGGSACTSRSCLPKSCGVTDDGCGAPLDCGGCEGNNVGFAVCGATTHLCTCQSANSDVEAAQLCKALGVPLVGAYFCGDDLGPSKATIGCQMGGKTTGGMVVACCKSVLF